VESRHPINYDARIQDIGADHPEGGEAIVYELGEITERREDTRDRIERPTCGPAHGLHRR
jgi:hypothetical protein